MQFTVSTIPEFSHYQFRKVNHFSVSHALHNNNHNTCLESLIIQGEDGNSYRVSIFIEVIQHVHVVENVDGIDMDY